LIALLEPGGEALQVGEVLASGALADLRVIGEKYQEGRQRIIRRTERALVSVRSNVSEKDGGPASVLDSSLSGSYATNRPEIRARARISPRV
jgi:hypothetical protein